MKDEFPNALTEEDYRIYLHRAEVCGWHEADTEEERNEKWDRYIYSRHHYRSGPDSFSSLVLLVLVALLLGLIAG